MSWLDDLIGPSPDTGGFENWLEPPSFTPALEQLGSGLNQAFQNIIPWQFPNREQSTGIPDIYHGAMGLIGAPHQGLGEIAGLGYDALGAQAPEGDIAAHAFVDIANKIDPVAGAASEFGKLTGTTPFINRIEENIGGMVTDPMMGLIPESKALGLAFAPGAAEQVYGGLKEGGQTGLADVLTGGGMLGMIAAAYAPDLLKRPELNTEGNPVTTSQPSGGFLADFNPLATGERGSIEFGPKKELPAEVQDLLNFNKSWPADSRFPPSPDTRPTPETLYHGSETPLAEIPAGAWLAKTPDEARVYGENVYPVKSEGLKNIPAGKEDIFGQELQKQGIAQRTAEPVPIGPELAVKRVPPNDIQRLKDRSNRINELKAQGLSIDDARDRAILEEQGKVIDIKAEPDTSELNSHVQEMKDKYGQRSWRNKMAVDEQMKFRELQNAAVAGAPEISSQSKQIEAVPAEAPKQTPQEPIYFPEVPPEKPPSQIPPPKTPPEKSKVLQPLSRFERIVYPPERNIAKMEPSIGKAEQSYRQFHETEASKAIGDIREATQGIGKESENRIVRYMDGESISLTPKEMNVATKLREVTDRIAGMAKDENVLTGYRKNYFTHINENIGEKPSIPTIPRKPGERSYGPLEKPRTREDVNIKRNFGVLEQYADKAIRRISEHKYLGPGLENVIGKKFISTPDKPGAETAAYLSKYVERLTGQERGGPMASALAKARKVTALGDLGFAALYQPLQASQIASAVGMRRMLQSAFETMRNYPKETLEATKTGALWPSISHEVGKAISEKGYMHGVPTLDKAMRVHANVAGRLLVQDALKGNRSAVEALRKVGVINFQSPDAVSRAGKLVADKTQYRTDVAHLPSWTQTPAGKLAFQYSSFMYAHSKYMLDLFKHPVQNFPAIMRLAATGVALGEMGGDVRAALKSTILAKGEEDDIIKRALEAIVTGDEKFDDKNILEKLQAVTRTKRIPITSPGWRALQNFAMIGGAGIFQNIIEKATDPKKFWQVPIGPAGALAVDTATATAKDIQKGTIRESGRNVIQNLPLPLIDKYRLANVVFPPQSRYNVRPRFKYPKVNFGR